MERANAEMSLLRGHLDAQRRHVLGILDGLSDEQLRQPVLPSGWHCLGLVQHLTLAVERYWFQSVVGGEPFDDPAAGAPADWLVGPDETGDAILGRYHREIAASDTSLAVTHPNDAPKRPDPVWAEWGMAFPDVRSVMLHVITETAVHAGHLDAVRELIDGRQWIVLD